MTHQVTKRDVGTVGHLPLTINSSCSVFLQMGRAISCRVTGSPCVLGADAILEI